MICRERGVHGVRERLKARSRQEWLPEDGVENSIKRPRAGKRPSWGGRNLSPLRQDVTAPHATPHDVPARDLLTICVTCIRWESILHSGCTAGDAVKPEKELILAQKLMKNIYVDNTPILLPVAPCPASHKTFQQVRHRNRPARVPSLLLGCSSLRGLWDNPIRSCYTS